MLVPFYKIMFDISFYYSLAAFLIGLLFREETNPFTFMVLLLGALLSSLAEKMQVRGRLLSMAAVLMPAVAFLWETTKPGCIGFLVPWIYMGIVVVKEKYGQDYHSFINLCRGLVWVWLIYLIGTSFNPEGGVFGLEQCAPYIILTLMSGVMLLQNLRYQEGSGSTKTFEKFQIKQAVFFLAGSVLLTVGRVAQLILYFMEQVFLPVMRQLVQRLVAMLFSVKHVLPEVDLKPEQEYLEFFQSQVLAPDIEGIPEDVLGGMAAAQPEEQYFMDWTPYLIGFAVLVTVVVLAVLFFNSIQKQKTPDDADEREDMEELTVEKKKPKKHSLHPELVIRYYYRSFIKKAEWGSNTVEESDTTAEIADKFLCRKPLAKDAAEEITELYRMVRYSRKTVGKEASNRMKHVMKRI